MSDQSRRTPSPCWGAFDGVALHEAHAYDGKWCPGLSGRGSSCGECGGTGLVTVISQEPPDCDERECRSCASGRTTS